MGDNQEDQNLENVKVAEADAVNLPKPAEEVVNPPDVVIPAEANLPADAVNAPVAENNVPVPPVVNEEQQEPPQANDQQEEVGVNDQQEEVDVSINEPAAADNQDAKPKPEDKPEAEKEVDPFEIFQPRLYNFELDNYNKLKSKLFQNTRPDNLEIRCPEFNVLLDHTIALLFLFYNDNKNWNLFTVPQIDWALKFISGIVSANGFSFTDMDTIKRHLELLLFETYSETDITVLEEKPPTEDVGVFGPINCPERTKSCTPIPESLKELMGRTPDMVTHLYLSTDSESETDEQDDLETSRKLVMQSAYLKLNSFERKHLDRINEEIDLFELIKSLKGELGYSNGNVKPDEITTLKHRVEEMEQMLLDETEHHENV